MNKKDKKGVGRPPLFTGDELDFMKKEFRKNPRPDQTEIYFYALRFGKQEHQIRSWFSNARTRLAIPALEANNENEDENEVSRVGNLVTDIMNEIEEGDSTLVCYI